MFDLKYATAKMIIVDLHTRFSRSWVNVGSKNYIIADSAQAEYCTTLHSMECGLWGAKIRQNDWIFGPYLVLNCNNNGEFAPNFDLVKTSDRQVILT